MSTLFTELNALGDTIYDITKAYENDRTITPDYIQRLNVALEALRTAVETVDIIEKQDEPFYPAVSEEGKLAMLRLLERFKFDVHKELTGVVDDVLGEAYSSMQDWIELDSIINVRTKMQNDFSRYENSKEGIGVPIFRNLRKTWLRQNHDDVVADLNQDLVAINNEQAALIKVLREQLDSRC